MNKANQSERIALLLQCGAIREKSDSFSPVLLEEEFDGKKLAGVCGIQKRHLILPALFLSVGKKYWNKGIGTRLVKRVVEKKRGPVFLTVARENTAAKKIYRKNGFRSVMPWRKIAGKPHELMLHF